MEQHGLRIRRCSLGLIALFVSAAMLVGFIGLSPDEAMGQGGLMVYPAKGQSAQQQQNDEGACYGWAKQQSGFDPARPPQGAPPPPAKQGQVVKGAAGGALVGVTVGAIAGDAGKGAAAGAAGGALIGGMKKRSQKKEQEAYTQQQNAAHNQGLANYNRAFSACMEGRGYTVK